MKDSTMYQRLLNISRRLISESDINQVLSIAIDEVIEIAGAERGLIILFAEDGATLIQTARNLEREDIEHPEFEISHTIINEVKSNGNTIYLHNALKHQKFKKSKSATRLKILSVICLPLRHESKIFGVVYLDNRTVEGAFTHKDCQFIESFTDFISLAAQTALKQKKLMNRVTALETELRSKYQFDAIIGHDSKMVAILKLITHIANTEATILIQGESGTGKELIANALHYNSSRKDKPFVPINCGALPENLLESELFGHQKGAFTGAIADKPGWFERAEGGTIFLDEVSEMSPELQVKLLRVLQTGEFSRVGSTEIRYCNLRIIAATNQNLKNLVIAGKFREDLYYRLNVIDIELPPLRERKGDISLLAHHFINVYGKKYQKMNLLLSRDAEVCLLAYDFPGNVRELENIIQRAVVLAEGSTIEIQHLPVSVGPAMTSQELKDKPSTFKLAKQRMIEKFECEYIMDCLKAAQGNISRAAQIAGIHFKNFYAKMVKYGIDPHVFKKAEE